MDRLLRPEKFDAIPEDSESTKIFDYWLRIFEGFIAAVAANVGENEEANKLLGSQNPFICWGSRHLQRSQESPNQG